jgi:hypothetical protein
MSKSDVSVCVPLFGGIGNVLQAVPFALAMKERYVEVAAYVKSLENGPASLALVKHHFSRVYGGLKDVPPRYKVFKHATRRSYPEYLQWFVENGEGVPAKLPTSKPPVDSKVATFGESEVVLWAECKPNWPMKRWPYWVDLSRRFKSVAVVGTEKSPKFPSHVMDWRGKLSILETGHIINRCKVFAGNEGGLVHYAAALGKKVVVVYGGTDQEKNLPPNPVVVVSKGLPCQPCQFNHPLMDKRNPKLPVFLGCKHRRCLVDLGVAEVCSVVKEALLRK